MRPGGSVLESSASNNGLKMKLNAAHVAVRPSMLVTVKLDNNNNFFFPGLMGSPLPTTPSTEIQMCWTTEKRDSKSPWGQQYGPLLGKHRCCNKRWTLFAGCTLLQILVTKMIMCNKSMPECCYMTLSPGEKADQQDDGKKPLLPFPFY